MSSFKAASQIGKRTFISVACLLENMIMKNEQIYATHQLPVTCFNAAVRPNISVHDYVERFYVHAQASDSVLTSALIYIDRITQKGFILTHMNVHRLFLACVLTSAKFLQDECFKNDYFAKVGGVTLKELNRLEVELLKLISFRLFISEEQYRKISDGLAQHQNVLRTCVCPTPVAHTSPMLMMPQQFGCIQPVPGFTVFANHSPTMPMSPATSYFSSGGILSQQSFQPPSIEPAVAHSTPWTQPHVYKWESCDHPRICQPQGSYISPWMDQPLGSFRAPPCRRIV